ncbi:MAG TPA: sulfate ABC transporter substrate-binding protein [Gaiellaceae bacterium]|jgi:sulfate/thiosulfate-binding protein
MPRLTRPLTLLAIAFLVAIPTIAASAAGKSANLTLVAYSTPKTSYDQIIPAFKATPEGSGVTFSASYGASGTQAAAVIAGLKADVVNLSLQPDMTTLVNAGIVSGSWSSKRISRYHGMVTNSIVVFAVRSGNPKKIRGWNDLLKPGVDVITPNPFTSGGARWNVMAAYGAWRKAGLTHKQAVANLTKLFQHVSVQDTSARNALQTFLSGKGDVLLSYENEAYAAKKLGQPIEYHSPARTILIENPVAVTKTTPNPVQAAAFVSYLFTPAAQKLFANNGYRPVVPNVFKQYTSVFPTRKLTIFNITDRLLGGWKKVQPQFFDPRTGIMAKIEAQVGGVTG